MKTTIAFLAISALLCVLPAKTFITAQSIKAASEAHTADYTYVRVYENGVWWIYVYDGPILIDRYECEER
jgi:hypothetical protein